MPTAAPVDLAGPTVLDQLEDAATGTATMVFRPSGESVPLADLWRRAHAACVWYQDRMAPGSTVVLELDSSPSALAALAGGWLAGMRVASVTAASAVGDHLAGHEGDGHLLVPGRRAELPGATPFEAVVACDPRRARPVGGGVFVQHSSGSTGDPKGVVLGLDALAANVEAIIDVFEDGEPLTTVSWLPLSHDMGLIGLCLAPWAYAGRVRTGGTIALLQPEYFLRSPSSWLRTCSELGAHATCGPNFALDLVARRPPRGDLDLSPLRIVCSGSEPVRAETLRAFTSALAPLGLSPHAPCPAYGLAEAALAVTCVRPSEPWRAIRVDAGALADGEVVPTATGVELVSAGRPVLDTEVAIADDGQILVRGPSLCDGYTGSRPSPVGADGWLRTGDLGFVHDGELFVAGRLDATFHVGGRAVNGTQVEQVLAEVPGIVPGRCAAVAEDGGYTVVAERRRVAHDDELVQDIRRALVASLTVAPQRIVLLAARAFPTTPNGKARRRAVVDGLRAGVLDIVRDTRPPQPTDHERCDTGGTP